MQSSYITEASYGVRIMKSLSVQEAIARAREAATKQLVTEETVLPVKHEVAQPSPPTGLGTIEDKLNTNIQVDHWLKVRPHGFYLSTNMDLEFKEFLVSIDLDEVKVTRCLRVNDPTMYFKTYDGVRATTGQLWSELVETTKKYPKVVEYDSFDIPTVLMEDLVVNDKVLATKGQTIGIGLSPTNTKFFRSFLDSVRKHYGTLHVQVVAKIFSQRRKNPGYADSGLAVFQLVTEVKEVEDASV